MGKALGVLMTCALACGSVTCGGTATPARSAGKATVTIGDKTFDVSDVHITYATGADGYFRVEGGDAAHPDQDCLPGLSGGLALYGDVPADATSLADLAGRDLPFEFTGDGDDANLCFVGSEGLLGVEQGTVRFTVSGPTDVAFSFAGRFVNYDGAGGQSPDLVTASGSGSARVAD